MNMYDQYLAVLQMFFHRQEKETPRPEKTKEAEPPVKNELFRDAA